MNLTEITESELVDVVGGAWNRIDQLEPQPAPEPLPPDMQPDDKWDEYYQGPVF